MSTILCTGGAGFIGSHLVDRLLKENHRVICFDNFDNFYNPTLKWRNIEGVLDNPNFKLVSGNVTDPLSLEKAFNCWKIDAVVHLAAQAGIRPSVQNPGLHFNVNVLGTVNVLELCRKNEVGKFVFASSSSVYGNNPNIPFKEDAPSDYPLCPYAASKKAGELICYTYHHLYKMDIACIRPFTVYGPRQRLEMAIPLFTKLIYEGKQITLHDSSQGEISRDFTYVDDVVSGIVGILSMNHGYEIYNLGSNRTVCMQELIYALENRLKRNAIIKHAPLESGEALKTYADISKAQKKFWYCPTHTIYEGLDKFVVWFLEDRKNAL
jgi:UDP-glucuronate 4-epimerase